MIYCQVLDSIARDDIRHSEGGAVVDTKSIQCRIMKKKHRRSGEFGW